MSRERLILVGVAVVALGLVGMLVFGGGDDEPVAPTVVLQDRDTDEAGSMSAEVDAHAETGPELLRVLADPLASAADLDARVMPEAYRRDLGIVSGRLVEGDGTPVPDMAVALVGGRPSMVLEPASTFLALSQAELLESVDPLSGVMDVIVGDDVTDEEGRFQLVDLEPRTIGALLIDAGGPRAHVAFLPATPESGEHKDIGDIVMPGSITFVGRVVDQRGKAIPGARVRATNLPSYAVGMGFAEYRAGGGILAIDDDRKFSYIPPAHFSRLERLLPFPTTETDADGAFELTGVPPGLVSVAADHIDYIALVHGPVPSGATGARRDLGALHLMDGSALVGRVIDSDDAPVEGVVVHAGNQIAIGPVAVLKGPVVTDAEGRFEIKGLKPSAAYARALPPDRADPILTDVVYPGTEELILEIPAPRDLTVTLLAGEEAHVSGARFWGRRADAFPEEVPFLVDPPRALRSAESLEEPGIYTLAALDPVEWELAVRVPGHVMHTFKADLSVKDAAIEVVLPTPETLTVTIVRAGDGTPVEWARVTVKEDRKDFPLVARRTNGDGVVVFDNLTKGEYDLDINYPGLAITETEVALPEQSAVTIELQLGGTIVGTVSDNGRPPTIPIMLTLEPRGGSDGDAEVPRMTTALPDGSFAFHRVDPGRVEIQARDATHLGKGMEGLFTMAAESPLAEAEVEVAPGGESSVELLLGSTWEDMDTGFVRGTLYVNGAPGSGWRASTWGKLRRSTTVNGDGSFDLGRVAAGNVDVLFSPGGGGFMGPMGSVDAVSVEVGLEETVWVEGSLSTGSVSGRVYGPNGRPLEGVPVQVLPTGDEQKKWWRQNFAITGTDGSFTVEPVAAGEYRVETRADGYARGSSDDFEVREMARVSGLELRLVAALTLSGTVTLVGLDEPPRYKWLMATRESDGASDATGIRDDDGHFDLDQLGPGTWTLRVATEHGEEAFEPIVVEVAESRSDLDLEFLFIPEDEQTDALEALKALGYLDG